MIGSNQKVFTDIKKADYDISAKCSVIDHKMIMLLNGESIIKLAKFPFVLEVWKKQRPEDKLLGLVKLNLQQFCASLFENETINTIMMLQQNKYPTIVYDNSVSIQNLQGNQELGEVELVLAIGTPIQINKIEQTRIQEKRDAINKQLQYQQKLKNEQILREITPEKKQQLSQIKQSQSPQQTDFSAKFNDQKLDLNMDEVNEQQYLTPSELFTLVLERIRRASNQLLPKLKEFILRLEESGKKLSKVQFSNFLESLSLQELTKQKLMDFTELMDYKSAGEVDGAEFMESYNNYYELEGLVREELIQAAKDLKVLLANSRINLSDFENFLNKETQFGYLKIAKFKSQLSMINFVPAISQSLVERVVQMMDVNNDGYIFVTDLIDYLRKLDVYENLSFAKFPKLTFYNAICKKVFTCLIENQCTVDKLFRNMAIQIPSMGIEHVRNLFYLSDVDISVWEAFVLIEQINQCNQNKMKVFGEGKFEVSFEFFQEFCENKFHQFMKGKKLKSSQYGEKSQVNNASRAFKNQKESAMLLKTSTESVNDIANLLNQKSGIKVQSKDENQDKSSKKPSEIKQQQQDQEIDQQNQQYHAIQHDFNSSPATPSKRNKLLPQIDTFINEMKHSPSDGKLTLEQKKLQIEADNKFLAENENQNLNYMIQLQLRESAQKERQAQQFNIIQQQQQKLDEQARIIQQWEQTAVERNDQKAKEFRIENCSQVQHSFTIQANGIEQLIMDDKLQEKILAFRYLFPKSESLIESSQFQVEAKRQDYLISMIAKHRFILDKKSNIMEELKHDNNDGLLIQLVHKTEIIDQALGHCIIPWDDFSELCFSLDSRDQQTQKMSVSSTKVYYLYPLYNSLRATLCKLALQIIYKRKYLPFQEENIYDPQLPIFSSSTTTKRYLPKNCSVFLSIQRVRLDVSFSENEDEFESQCSVELFNGLPLIITDPVRNRRDYYPKFNGNWDLELTEQAIDKFKTSNATVRLIKNSIAVATGNIKLVPLLVSEKPITFEIELIGNESFERIGVVTVILGLESQGISDIKAQDEFMQSSKEGVVQIKLEELFSLEPSSQTKNLYFSYKQEKLSPLFQQEASPSQLTPLEDVQFWLDFKEISLASPLEISLFQKNISGGEDEMLGYLSINLRELMDSSRKQNKKIVVNNCYWCFVGIKKQMRIRVGGKVVLWFVNEQSEVYKLQKIGHVFGKSSFKEEELKEIDQYLQHNCKLSYGAIELLEKYLSKLTKFELFELFSSQIYSKLNINDLELGSLTFDDLKQELEFYDEKNFGFIEFGFVEKIFKQFKIIISEDQKEILQQFLCKNLISNQIDSTITISHFEEKFDYQLFLRKLLPQEYFSFSTKKVFDKINDTQQKLANYYETKAEKTNPFETNNHNEAKQEFDKNYNLSITIEMGRNFHALNKGNKHKKFIVNFQKGLPPNCIVKCENFQGFETQFSIREAHPVFNYTNSIVLNSKMIQDNFSVLFGIYHRSYNINYQQSISSLILIGQATINIEQLFSQYQRQLQLQQAYSQPLSQNFSVLILDNSAIEQEISQTLTNRSPILKINAEIEVCEKESALPSALVQNQNYKIQEEQAQQQNYLNLTPQANKFSFPLQQRYSSSDKKYNHSPLQIQNLSPGQFNAIGQQQIENQNNDQFQDELGLDIVENFNKTMEEIYRQTDDQIQNLNQQLQTTQMEKQINELENTMKNMNPSQKIQNENYNFENIQQPYFDKTIDSKYRSNYHQNQDKPPIIGGNKNRLSSYKRLRQIEDKLKFSIKDNQELERIANIMKKQDISDKQKYFDVSSDSDS